MRSSVELERSLEQKSVGTDERKENESLYNGVLATLLVWIQNLDSEFHTSLWY